MRRSFQIACFFLSPFLFSTTAFSASYYLAVAGNNADNGLSVTTPWQTIAHLNTQIGSFPAGTRIYFRRGDVFQGQIDLAVNGTAGNKIIFDAYGTGADPVINAAVIVKSWTLHSGSIWKCQMTSGPVKQLFDNYKRLGVARYPDTGYLRVDAGGTNTSFTDAALTQVNGYFTGCQVVTQPVDWAWEYRKVTSSTSGGVLTYEPSSYAPDSDAGYFFQNKYEFITASNEWYYDSLTNYVYLHSATDPDNRNISASVYEYGIKGNWNRQHISVNNLAFNAQYETGIWLRGATCEYLDIKNCSFTNQNKFSIQLMGDSLSVTNCTFNDVAGIGIEGSNISRFIFNDNNFSRIGLCPGMGSNGTGDLQAMRVWGGSNAEVKGNRIDSTGYCGITINVNDALIAENIISNALLFTSDGGALYSYSNTTFNNTYQNNIIHDVPGNITARPPGIPLLVMGIYLDNDVYGVLLSCNTIYNISGEGIRINAGSHDNIIDRNTVYKSKEGICFSDWHPGNSVYNNTMTRNVLYTNVSGGVPVLLQSTDNNYNMLSVSDSNYLCNPYSTKAVDYVWSQTQSLTLSQWKAASSLDVSSKESFYQWTYPADSSFLIVNNTGTSVTHIFSNTLDLDNNPVTTVTLLPFASKVLIGGFNVTTAQSLFSEVDLSIFPNPSSEVIYFNCEKNISGVVVHDIYGKMVSSAFGENIKSMGIKHLPAGIYMLDIGAGDSGYKTKMIKE